MRGRWAIGIGVVSALLAMLVVNALVTDGETGNAHVTVLMGAEEQIVADPVEALANTRTPA